MSTGEPKLVFIKDYWYAEGTRPELDTYTLLHEHHVPHIAKILAGGDVGGPGAQTTASQTYFSDGRRPSKRIHHRIVTDRIGRRLDTYRDQKELLVCTYHAFLGARFRM